MFLKRIEVVNKNDVRHFIVGTPMETVVTDVKIKPDPNKIIKTIELSEELLKIEYGDNEVTWIPINKATELHFKKED
ncbi:MAG: hypothetical protein ISP01_08035 [Methanobrevibacter arboriphilus]|uniref:Uncharacterized protein n=1 Tax=Methanobrevibacter arboriphilus TaxID=39441 RepID=A0A843AE58_METAZ|nr:hypothetical protein [Methanobrevibacter arboriphilus]MBF4469342.1 hypothetical protein [Methanobrevibacter arboriphilus]MCC7561421.1 hypothetical protein [Methanobrevibacter arboriphilus]